MRQKIMQSRYGEKYNCAILYAQMVQYTKLAVYSHKQRRAG